MKAYTEIIPSGNGDTNILIVTNKEAKIIAEALEHYSNANKRKRAVKTLLKNYNDIVECY